MTTSIPTRVAVASRSFSRYEFLRKKLTSHYPNAKFNDADQVFDEDGLVNFLRGHDGAIIGLERVTDGVLCRLPELRIISKYGVGLDNIDITALSRHGVRLAWTGGVNKRAVSEIVVAMAIALLRHVPELAAATRNGAWSVKVGRQLTGKTVGIVGCGHIGKDVAKLMRAFDCRVLANDIVDDRLYYSENGIEPADLSTLLQLSDIVTLHVPLNSSTKNLLSRDRISLMKKDAILINAARGGLVDEVALLDALKTNAIAGAGLDVLAKEPPKDLALLQQKNVLVTPHLGGSAIEAIAAMGEAAFLGLSRHRDASEFLTN